jgi:branched-chain amino acid transport system ATP-binding protein
MLDCQDIHSYYGTAHILQGVSLRVGDGEVVALLGRNGAGKTTTLKSIVGLVPPRKGKVLFKGQDVTGRAPHKISRAGVALVPETRGIFSYLSTRENLDIAVREGSRWNVSLVLDVSFQ